jgi:dTDP-glucose 4,6-dehydratase
MKLFVTGGAGFIGSNFINIQTESDKWEEIIVIDKLTYAGDLRNIDSHAREKIKFIKADICDVNSYFDDLVGADYVINFAAESHVDRSIANSTNFIQTNVVGAHAILEASRIGEVKTFIQISTDEVYGSITEGSWNENSILHPNSPYAASKAATDLICLSYFYTYGLDVRITRCSNNYGPGQFPEKLIPLAINKILNDEKVPIYGKGQNIRDWIHVTDHCRAIELVIAGGQPGQIYNIGARNEVSNLDLINLILKNLNRNSDQIEFVSDRLGHDFRYSVSPEKIENDLEFVLTKNFEEGILETIAWYVGNT